MSAPRKFWQLHDAAWLRGSYEVRQRSMEDIAKEIGCSFAAVNQAIRRAGIQPRSANPVNAGPAAAFAHLNDREWLEHQYVGEGLSMERIARLLGCTSGAVLKAMRRHNIEARPAKGPGRRASKLDVPQLSDPDWLDREFRVFRKSTGRIAAELKCSRGPVLAAIRRFGITRRHARVAKRQRSAEVFPPLANREWLKVEYLDRNRTAPAIAAELGCTVWAVQAALARWRLLKFPGKATAKRDASLPIGTIEKDGYLLVFAPDHPFANGKGYVAQHRLVCEEALGRYLTPEEEVHHLNEVRSDNRVENLLVMPDFLAHRAFHHNPPPWVPRCDCCGRVRPELVLKRPEDVPLEWVPGPV